MFPPCRSSRSPIAWRVRRNTWGMGECGGAYSLRARSRLLGGMSCHHWAGSGPPPLLSWPAGVQRGTHRGLAAPQLPRCFSTAQPTWLLVPRGAVPGRQPRVRERAVGQTGAHLLPTSTPKTTRARTSSGHVWARQGRCPKTSVICCLARLRQHNSINSSAYLGAEKNGIKTALLAATSTSVALAFDKVTEASEAL